MTRSEPYRQFRFRVEFDGKDQGGFSECTFADTTNEPIEYREGNEPPKFRKLSGLTKYGNITLKRGTMESKFFYEWIKDIMDSGTEGKRKSMSIILLDETSVTGKNDVARWNIVNAWPTKYKPSDLNAKTNDVALESLEIAHEGFSRES